MLGRKQSIKNSDWLEALEHIEETISQKEVDDLAEKTIEEIRKSSKGKKSAYAWSGGKDSIVLGDLCEKAGVHESMISLTNLEYPAFEKWVYENKPDNCEVVNTGQDLDWIAKNQIWLFPEKPRPTGWSRFTHQRGQNEYYRNHKLDLILLGRRIADGNVCGKGIYTDSKGMTKFNPIARWSHEAVLAYIHYHELPTPPIYGWKNGYLCGTHPWALREHTKTIENGWREVYEIDKSIVETASERIESARHFLLGGGEEN